MTTHCGIKTTGIRPPLALETRCLRSGCPRAERCPEAPSQPLPASGGSGHPSLGWWLWASIPGLGAPGVHPWAGGHLPPVSTSVSTWLLLCVRVSPLLSLTKTLSLGLGPPPPRRTSSQTLHSITAAENLCPNKARFSGSGGEDMDSCLGSRDSTSYTGVVEASPIIRVISYFRQRHFHRQGPW